MINKKDIVFLQPLESARYIIYSQSTSSDFIQYQNSDSLIPSSLDQIIKNNIIIYDDKVLSEKS
jgi:hypothetical protein